MQREKIEHLIACLEQAAGHPDRFRNVIPRGQELGYITGVSLGVRFAIDLAYDLPREHKLRAAAAEARGWTSDRHPYEQMLDRNLSADEILSELLRLEADVVKLATCPER